MEKLRGDGLDDKACGRSVLCLGLWNRVTDGVGYMDARGIFAACYILWVIIRLISINTSPSKKAECLPLGIRRKDTLRIKARVIARANSWPSAMVKSGMAPINRRPPITLSRPHSRTHSRTAQSGGHS